MIYKKNIFFFIHADKNIKRSLIHPHFDSDTFANNIGLLQHDSIHNLYEYKSMYLPTHSFIYFRKWPVLKGKVR